MKILVLSDSHSSLSFMRRCISHVRPKAVIHLGDYYDDGRAMAEENPHIYFYQVPGNCDRYNYEVKDPEIRITEICGVKMYLTHGHLHGVKTGLWRLTQDARAAGVQAALFGHTHSAWCTYEDGLWVINPGSCGYYGGSAAVLTVEDNKISDCQILRQSEMEW